MWMRDAHEKIKSVFDRFGGEKKNRFSQLFFSRFREMLIEWLIVSDLIELPTGNSILIRRRL